MAALTWQDFTGFLSLIDVTTGKIVQQVGTGSSSDPAIGDGSVAADGPFYSPDGKSLWVPQSTDLLRFTVGANGLVNATPLVIPLTGPNGPALPSGMAFSPDGSKAYVALNGSNTLGVIDTATNALVTEIPVGNAPRQVVLVGDQAFVSNEGGRGEARRLHQPLRRHADRVGQGHGGGHHRNGLRCRSEHRPADRQHPRRPGAHCHVPARRRALRS